MGLRGCGGAVLLARGACAQCASDISGKVLGDGGLLGLKEVAPLLGAQAGLPRKRKERAVVGEQLRDFARAAATRGDGGQALDAPLA